MTGLFLAAAMAASVLAIPLGSAMALAASRLPSALRGLILGACMIALPVAASGVWAQDLPENASLLATAMAALRLLALALPVATLVLTQRLARLDPVLLEAASASGAGPALRLRLIILPWLAPSSLAALALCLAVELSGLVATALHRLVQG